MKQILMLWKLVLPRVQRRKFPARFLRGNEIGVGGLPDVEQLLIALRRGCLIELRLRPRGSQQAQRIVWGLRSYG